MTVSLNAVVTIGLCIMCLGSCVAEIHSSMAHMQNFIRDTHTKLSAQLPALEKFLAQQQEDFDGIQSLIQKLCDYAGDIHSPDFTLHHPLNAYRFIRNFSVIYNQTTTQLMQEIDLFEKDVEDNNITVGENLKLVEEDLKGIYEGLVVVQYTYDFNESDIAAGNIGGYQAGLNMSAKDCSAMMVTSYEKYSSSPLPSHWMNLALDMVAEGDNSTTIADIYADAAKVLAQLNLTKEAAKMYEKLVEYDPKNRLHKKKLDNCTTHIDPKAKGLSQTPKDKEEYRHNQLCQGFEVSPKPDVKKSWRPLKCRLLQNHPLLVIDPGKMEERSLEPYIILFHGLLNPGIIQKYKKSALPRLQRSRINVKGKPQVAPRRTSKGYFLKDSLSDKYLGPRVSALTGLRCETSCELLQIANYGVGGQYYSHKDFFVPEHAPKDNRMATFMIYLSTVESGGATVFPNVGEMVTAEQGKAIFWYNLYKNGTTNHQTMHAACPVVMGEKWVGNYWIHEHGHEFIRPCSLDRYDTRWP